jgi:hypothetical protein
MGIPSPVARQRTHFRPTTVHLSADRDLRAIGTAIDNLVRLRNRADYQLALLADFASDAKALTAISEAADAIALLDAIDADSTRRTAAIAAIQAAFP